MLVHLDLSEIIHAPLRTGIQRIEREAIRHWPKRSEALIPCLVDGHGMLRKLRPQALDILCASDEGTRVSRATERRMLQDLAATSEPISNSAVNRLLNLELFSSPVRAETHIRLANSGVRVFWYVYDFIPYLRPEFFPFGTTRHFMHYLRALRGIGNRVAFLSNATRSDYLRRITRQTCSDIEMPVIDPGADGLGLQRQAFSSNRRHFFAIGTLEPRKNPMAMLNAFAQLWQEGVDAPLVVAGRLAPDVDEVHTFLRQYKESPLLTVLDEPSDETLRGMLGNARALIMPSEVEGFGLPPYEALHAGIPAIASMSLPSAALMKAGAILLERMDTASIAGAVRKLLDDREAVRLWHETTTLNLPTWADFGRTLSEWVLAV